MNRRIIPPIVLVISIFLTVGRSLADTGVGQPPKSPFHPIPIQNYAVVDVSGTSTTNYVNLIALDDDNHVAFSYTDAVDNPTKITVKTWQNGVVSPQPAQIIPLWNVISADAQGKPTEVRSISAYADSYSDHPPGLRSNGDFLVNVGDGTFGTFEGTYLSTGGFSSACTISGGKYSDLGTPLPPYTPEPTGETDFSGKFSSIAPNGCALYVVGHNDPPLPYYSWGTLVVAKSSTGSSQVLFDPSMPASAPDASIRVVSRRFVPYMGNWVNANGWVIGYADGDSGTAFDQLWNGDQIIPLPSAPTAINDSNDVLVAGTLNYATYQRDGAAFLDKGTTWIPFTGSGTTNKLLPDQYKDQIRNIYPKMLSNRLDIKGSDVQPVLNIVFYAETRRNSSDGPWQMSEFLLRKFSDGTTDLHEMIGAADGTVSINSSGVIAAIGYAGMSDMHALLLLPFAVHVDADNTTSNGYPDEKNDDLGGAEYSAQQSDDEEHFPGVRVFSNTIDCTGNGVVDYADGIDKFGNGNDGVCLKFEPMLIKFPFFDSFTDATLVFKYSSSDPDQMTKEGEGSSAKYILPQDGLIRLWTKDGDKTRKPQSTDKNGDFVQNDVEYSLTDLGWQGDDTIKLYIEVVDTDVFDRSSTVEVEFYPYGKDHPESVGEDKFKVRPYYVSRENPN